MLLLVMLLSSLAFGSSPKFFVREKKVDLGEFFEGKDIEYEFTIMNTGAGELHINNVKPG